MTVKDYYEVIRDIERMSALVDAEGEVTIDHDDAEQIWALLLDYKDLLMAEEAVDAVPVVRCKDCEYSYDEISYLCCSHGVCVDCEVPPNFYCAYGKRRAENEPPEEGET